MMIPALQIPAAARLYLTPRRTAPARAVARRPRQAPPAQFGRYLTQREERQLMAAVARCSDVAARRDYHWMRLLRYTGLRVETLAGLTVGHAWDALDSGVLAYDGSIAKGGRGGSVRVPTKAQQSLRALLGIRKEQGGADEPDAPLILSRKHAAMAIRSYQDRMAYWRRAAGLQVPASPHWWRHTCAMRLLAATEHKDPLAVVQAHLNHSSRASTAVYTRPSREDVARAVEAM